MLDAAKTAVAFAALGLVAGNWLGAILLTVTAIGLFAGNAFVKKS